MANPIGPLGAADERFDHQIADTFAVVSQSDPSWTEKVCAMAVAKDGSLQLGFGLGKYPNRNVMDGYGGVSRGVEQITVRGSRRLSPAPDVTAIGPVRYEVLEPLQRVRFALDANDTQPIAFDWVFEASLVPQLEERSHRRSPSGYRVATDLVRYHQIGLASGWVEVEGERTEITPETWVSTRDHSWGVRYDVGLPPTDVDPTDPMEGLSFLMFWSPSRLERPDGSHYGLFFHTVQVEAPGFVHAEAIGGFEHPDGTVEPIVSITPDDACSWHAENRRFQGGPVHLGMADGSTRTITLEVLGDTGLHLGAGLYFGWQGHHHGEWRGDLVVEGERIADCTDPAVARELHQIRDTVVRVSDPTGGGEGIGNCQPIAVGRFERWGLDNDSSFW
jgi:hypothetical protein